MKNTHTMFLQLTHQFEYEKIPGPEILKFIPNDLCFFALLLSKSKDKKIIDFWQFLSCVIRHTPWGSASLLNSGHFQNSELIGNAKISRFFVFAVAKKARHRKKRQRQLGMSFTHMFQTCAFWNGRLFDVAVLLL